MSLFVSAAVPSAPLAVLGFSLFGTFTSLFNKKNAYKEKISVEIKIKAMKKRLLFTCGIVLTVIAAIGVFVPLLPTTPLVLLAAMCFSSSSEKAYNLLLKSRFFGPYIENYKTKQGVPMGAKMRAIIMLWALLIISLVAIHRLWSTIMFIAIGIGVSIHLLLLKTKKT